MVTLTQGRILQTWSTLLDDCAYEDDALLHGVEQQFAGFGVPEICCQRDSVAPGFIDGVLGKRYECIVVEHARFRPLSFYVLARPYGRLLDVVWHLAGAPNSSLVDVLARSDDRQHPFSRAALDVFDRQDLHVYVALGHRAVRRAIEDVLKRRALPTRIDWKSEGPFTLA